MLHYHTTTQTELLLVGNAIIDGVVIANTENLTLPEKKALNLLPIDEVENFDLRYQSVKNALYDLQQDKVIKTYQIENNTAIYPDLVQARLDAFAKEKDFDGINDACSYVFSTNLTWRAEAERAVELRDSTWQAFYSATSTDWLEIEADLPALTWL